MKKYVNRRKIIELMRKYDMKNQDLADAAGVDVRTVKRLRGRKPHTPKLETIVAIAQVFKVDFSELLED